MLEGLVAWVLKNYLGKYVELNTVQLSIALRSGKVELENLPLRKNALRHLGLPFDIKAGFVGKVKLQIPVTQIRSQPWVIQMDQLYLVACPLPVKEWNSVLEENAAQELKLSALDKLEAQWRFETEQDNTYYTSTYSSLLNFGTGFITDIIENLQLNIRDVHFRYEDNVSISGKAVAFGLTIDSLTAQTCNDSWTPGFSYWDKSDISYKLLEMQKLAVYCTQVDPEDLLSNLSLTDLAVRMASTQNAKFAKHYVVSPVSAKAQIKRNRSELPLKSDSPRIVCDLQLDDVPITILDWQYDQTVNCLRGLTIISTLRAYRRLRPTFPISQDARAWWLYAISCQHIDPNTSSGSADIDIDNIELPGLCRQRPTWDSCLKRARQMVCYVKLYEKVLVGGGVFSAEEKKVKEEVEWEWGYGELKVLRELAMRAVPVPAYPSSTSNPPSSTSYLMSWFPHYWYSSSTEGNSVSPVTTPSGTTPVTSNATLNVDSKQPLEGELLEALSKSVQNNTLLRRDAVFGQFRFTLKSGRCVLGMRDNEGDSLPMMELEFKNLSLNIVSKPRSSSHLIELSLGALYLRDKFTPSSQFPVIVGPPGQDRLKHMRTRGLIGVTTESTSNGKGGLEELSDQLFYISYEKKPENITTSCDYRLCIRTKSLDVVYQPSVVKWLTEFICLPHQRATTHSRIEAMKTRTKNELIKNWEQMLHGRNVTRKVWELQLDITAPQIFFVEKFNDPNAAIAVIDFGRLYLRNFVENSEQSANTSTGAAVIVPRESEDDETFMTPCSTPPVSEESDSDITPLTAAFNDVFDETALHQKIYDKYTVELTDMQILIGKVKDNWRYAHNKGTSTLHVLDRFNISLQIERRIVHTHDPQYPSLAVHARLPKLIAHINEYKVGAARTLLTVIGAAGLPSPFVTPQDESKIENNGIGLNGVSSNGAMDASKKITDGQKLGRNLSHSLTNDDSISMDTSAELSKLLHLQFAVDHMALEVQSRGRSVAELQVSGVRAAFTKRPVDVTIALTVHGLLLVDALQTFGPDFELLVASHKHVGMDSISGSLRDSEPTSPTSPGSPPDVGRGPGGGATSPISLSQALHSLAVSPPPSGKGVLGRNLLDAEALISVEIVLFTGTEPVQVANIQFNNLDIIANQETIVELIGFVHRVFPDINQSSTNTQSGSLHLRQPPNPPTNSLNHEINNTLKSHHNIHMVGENITCNSIPGSIESLSDIDLPDNEEALDCDQPQRCVGTTELTFDFHRLNVLLLRGVIKDGCVYGKKICTATMTEAKIQATVDSNVVVEGSLGGLQVIDLTPEGQVHQRIVSVGRDPLYETTHPLYMMSTGGSHEDERKAFSFKVVRSLNNKSSNDSAEVIVRMASLWYTHSPTLLLELQSCAVSFRHYVSHLARTIRSAATDVALGLVHARLSSKLLSSSLYGSALSGTGGIGGSVVSGFGLGENVGTGSPARRRRRSSSMEWGGTSGWSSVRDAQTPRDMGMGEAWCGTGNGEDGGGEFVIDVKLDIELDSPVVVLPRASNSSQVFVAHLGKIFVSNSNNSGTVASDEISYGKIEHYDIEIRDMNLFSLDTATRRVPGPIMSRPEILYCCETLAKPILHDTVVHLAIDRQIPRNLVSRHGSVGNILFDNDDLNDTMQSCNDFIDEATFEDIKITGNVVSSLSLSLTRPQYQQLLSTLDFLTSTSSIPSTTSQAKFSQSDNLTSSTTFYSPTSAQQTQPNLAASLANISEEDTGVTTLKMDPHVRAKLFPSVGKVGGTAKDGDGRGGSVHHVTMKVLFELPNFIIELRGDSPIGEQSLVDLTFRDFEFIYEKNQLYETNVQVSLRSILMTDLLQPSDSKQRTLVISSNESDTPNVSSPGVCISSSCPDIYGYCQTTSESHGSLPDNLEVPRIGKMVIGMKKQHHGNQVVDDVIRGGRALSRKEKDQRGHSVLSNDVDNDETSEASDTRQQSSCECPCTPPPSPKHKRCRQKNLVLISTLLVDPNAPNFKTHYNSVQRSTSVDFNCLDLVVSVESWVLVIDFFSASTSDHNIPSRNQIESLNPEEKQKTKNQFGDTETNISVKSLTVTLVRTDRDVAKANISNFDVAIKTSIFSKEVEGQLGSFSLHDLTTHGHLYRERFLTSGKQALHFKYSRFAPNESNTFDCQLKLKMSSVLYVHTKRFVVEIQAFFQHFSQLQSVMSGIRAATSGQTMEDEISRLSLILEAESPVILIPVSSKSCDLLIVDLGQLKVNNCFKLSGDFNTISIISDNASSKKCILDIMFLDLQNVNLHAGLRETDSSKIRSKRQSSYSSNDEYYDFYSCFVTKVGQSLLTEKCHLKIQVERNLESHLCHNVPDMSIHGELSTLDGTLNLSQYCLIRGLLSQNIGEDTEHILSSVQNTTTNAEAHLTDIWTLSSVRLDLLNVNIRLQQTSPSSNRPLPLACVNFIKSRLVIETFSNLSQDIDLVSQEILLRDTRYETTTVHEIDSTRHRNTQIQDHYEGGLTMLKDNSNRLNKLNGQKEKSLLRESQRRSFEEANRRNSSERVNTNNVFTDILRPIKDKKRGDDVDDGLVQVEIHSRRRLDSFKFTILLNNIRLMAVFDWWDLARSFILQDINTTTLSSPTHRTSHPTPPNTSSPVDGFSNSNFLQSSKLQRSQASSHVPFELKVNITDSELVVIEDITQADSNAVILKSTTVVTYKPGVKDKPLACNVNNCEVYSCVLGSEEETALSIIDPVTLNIDVFNHPHSTLELSLHHLSIRLSYRDMRMFTRIISSLPSQLLSTQQSDNEITQDHIVSSVDVVNMQRSTSSTDVVDQKLKLIVHKERLQKLATLGFREEDCKKALEQCDGCVNDAALWLTQNAFSVHSNGEKRVDKEEESGLDVRVIELKADIISLCIIDDCGDVDVPLLELSVAQLNMRENLKQDELPISDGIPEGALEGILSSDYYNRVLSGWEPIIEPWKCMITWDHTIASDLQRNRLQLSINSESLLNLNITSTLTELFNQVKDSWLQDLYSSSVTSTSMPLHSTFPSSSKLSTSSSTSQLPSLSSQLPSLSSTLPYRRRSPFVPYALKNETGCLLSFSTVITDMKTETKLDKTGSSWREVGVGETVPFTFKTRDKIRHSDSHKLRMHQLVIHIDGYEKITPITVDKVGVYFRDTSVAIKHRAQEDQPQARIVFDVALEGTARKLVTIRSALMVINKLPESVELKFETPLPDSAVTVWAPSRVFTLSSGGVIPVPLMLSRSFVSVKPNGNTAEKAYTYCKQLNWGQVTQPGDIQFKFRDCVSVRGHVHTYRFCAEIKREKYPRSRQPSVSQPWLQPAHTITLLPTVLLANLLPYEMHYAIGGSKGRLTASGEMPIPFVDVEKSVELTIRLENFPTCSPVVIPASCDTAFTCRIRMEDSKGRKIFLTANIVPNTDSKLKISISAPFWLLNKTGVPLVFRQNGVSAEAAGQFAEHELARMVAPLLFSFADPDASPAVVARVGSHVVQDGKSQWCEHFHLQRGIQVRKLRVTLHDGRPDVVFVVGIEVRRGRGKYHQTSIVTIAPRFKLYNRSSYQLQFAQSCFAKKETDHTSTSPSSSKPAHYFHLHAIPGCHMAFHWPRLDQEHLLCVRIGDVPQCCWSGALAIDREYSAHVNVRDVNGRVYFLRLEVVLEAASYMVVWGEGEGMPPPIRIDNFSEVTLKFAQASCKETVHSVARAHSSVPYAWDQPTATHLVNVEAPGGISQNYNLSQPGPAAQLTYENFIYIALTGTFKSSRNDPLDVENQELVLDVLNGRDVVLSHKRQGQRSQLWRMSTTGQLQHEGSSPPCHPQQHRSENTVLVLDIEGPAPQPSQYTRLVLRRPDRRRQSTQTWRFTEEGRLCCAHYNMCVQAQDGFFGIRQGRSMNSSHACWQQWNSVVLGLPQPITHCHTDSGVPLEQAVGKQRLRPGSGFLSVEITTDGPTKVIRIRDIKEMKKRGEFCAGNGTDWLSISVGKRPFYDLDGLNRKTKEYQLILKLKGIGMSLIARKPPQELLYAQFADIISETTVTENGNRFCISIRDIQIDNQLLEAPIPVFLYVTPQNSRSSDSKQAQLPALDISVKMQPIVNQNAVIFDHLIVRLKKITIHLEERLLLKLFAFFQYNSSEEQLTDTIDEERETQRILTEVGAAHAKRYYFGIIQLVPDQIRLSMKTALKLPVSLQQIKKKLGLTFIKFEDAAVDLEAYIRKHPFETIQVLVQNIVKHFKGELMWQAGIILGSVDFLGNPLGFVNDVTDGVSSLLKDGDVRSLVGNVAHGLSDSAAKVTESISDGLGKVTMDAEHEEMRQRILRQVGRGRPGRDHIVAGFKGLGFGILGGATGIFKQVYEGGSNDGVQGVFSGIGKGLLGAVTKPVVGVLDLASETARAVRDSSRSANRIIPERCRPPRCVIGAGGLLPRYNKKHSKGQLYLFVVNERTYAEQLVAYENLRSGSEDLRIVISNQKIRIVTQTESDTQNLTVVIDCHLSDLEECIHLTETESSETRHYIELTIHVSASGTSMIYMDPVKKPRVRCDTSDLAKRVSRQINHAKRLYDERLHTLTSDSIISQQEE